ncbi:MAG: ribonuclease P protein component, partial [Clostridia bacterium]|nr:ribonuclease P protein component [Clostridia bacterium]
HLFVKAYTKGQKVRGEFVNVFILKDAHANRLKKENPQKRYINRLGITATKRIGGAVERCRARRIMREAYRIVDKNLNVKKGFLIVIAAKDGIGSAKTQDVCTDVINAFNRTGMIG